MNKFIACAKLALKGFVANHCTMHAAGLTYFSLLAVIPVLCCILVAAKACGVDHYARNHINARIDAMIESVEKGQDDTLAQLDSEESRCKKKIAAEEFAAQARSISNAMFERIDSFDVGTLGWIGFGFLLWTVISTLASVETSFNEIFSVPEPRPVWKRAYMYLFIMVVLPVLATVAMSLPILNVVKDVIIYAFGVSTLTKWAGDGLIWLLDSAVFRLSVTFASASLFFAFFLWVMPNCRVNFRKAWFGGMFTAFIFGAWVKICAVAQVGIAKSSALYGSFAFLPIVLAWLYMSWQIVLLGANVVRALGEDAK